MTLSFEQGDPYAGVQVAVLGASGFIGRWVGRALCEAGAQVHLVVRDRITAQPVFSRYGIQGEVYEADPTVPEALPKLFRRIRPSVVFNLIGYGVDRAETDEKMAYEVNAHLVGTICEAVLDVRDPGWPGQDIIHVGSALEYGSVEGNLAEDSAPNPTTLYGQSKLAGTRLFSICCGHYGIRGVTARLFTVYGPGEHAGRLLPSLMETAMTGAPLALTEGRQKRDFTYVGDVAKALLSLGAVSSSAGGIVNLATGHLTAVREFAMTAAQVLQIPQDRLRFGLLPTRSDDMEHAPVDLTRLRRLIGGVPDTSIEDGIRKSWHFNKEARA